MFQRREFHIDPTLRELHWQNSSWIINIRVRLTEAGKIRGQMKATESKGEDSLLPISAERSGISSCWKELVKTHQCRGSETAARLQVTCSNSCSCPSTWRITSHISVSAFITHAAPTVSSRQRHELVRSESTPQSFTQAPTFYVLNI